MTRHDPRHYLAGRRVSCSSGFIAGTPAPLAPLKIYDHGKAVAELEALAKKARYREGAKKGWRTRHASPP